MYEKELQAALTAVKEAEKGILDIYNSEFEVEIKADESPVTAADKGADELIRSYLGRLFPDYGFLTEESIDTPDRLKKKAIWVVDPVDGTKEFVSRNGQFTTNVALVVDHEVVVGVINAPVVGVCYYAVKGQGTYRVNKDGTTERIHVSDRLDHLRYMRSISFFNSKELAFYEKHADKLEGEAKPIGAALKFCYMAEGNAELFCRCSANTKEWDIAAGDIILSEAGGVMLQPDNTRFTYNRVDPYNRLGYVMANRVENCFLD